MLTDTRRRRPPVVPSLVAMGLAATSIGALLADLYGVTSMTRAFVTMTVPGMVGLVALATVHRPELEGLQRRIRVGAVAGVVGTIGYDVVRVPFAAAGLRVFAPIDSYGMLLANAHMASPWTNTLGWLFHLSNGVTFGVVYTVVAARRHWGWGVAWGVALESVVVLSPFLERYGLAGQIPSIALAYGAHVAFGYPLGRMVQRFDATDDVLHSVLRRPAAVIVGAAVLSMVVWHHPWTQSPARREAGRVAAQIGRPTAVVERDRFSPEWLRVDAGGCVHVVNHSASAYVTRFGTVDADGEGDLCFPPGSTTIKRVRLGDRAFSGGFVFVDGG